MTKIIHQAFHPQCEHLQQLTVEGKLSLFQLVLGSASIT